MMLFLYVIQYVFFALLIMWIPGWELIVAMAIFVRIDNSGGVYSMEIMDLYRERIDPNDGQPVDGKIKKHQEHVSIATMDVSL